LDALSQIARTLGADQRYQRFGKPNHYACPAGAKLTKVNRRADHTNDVDVYRHLSACFTCSQDDWPRDSVQKATFVLTIAPEFARVRYVSLQTGWYEAGFEQCYAFWPTGHCS
jgi:hypothetical protein